VIVNNEGMLSTSLDEGLFKACFAGLVKDVSDFYSSQRKISQVCWVMKF